MPVSRFALAAVEGLPCEITECGLEIEQGVSKETWEEIGNRLAVTIRGMQWVVGDWYLYGEQQWGHKYDDCEKRFGLSYSSVAHCVAVARRFQFWRRRQNLSFSHHRELTSLPDAQQDILLDKCEAEKIPSKAIRQHVRSLLESQPVDVFTDEGEEDASQSVVATTKADDESLKITNEFKLRLDKVADNGIYTIDALAEAFDSHRQSAMEFVRMCEISPASHVLRTYGRKGLTQYQFLRTNCVSAADRIRQLAERIATDPSGNSRVHSDATRILQLLGG